MWINSDGGDNILVYREALESEYKNYSNIHHPSLSSAWIDLQLYSQGLARWECNQSSRMMVRLTQN